MAIAVQHAPVIKPGRALFSSRNVRKVAILGSHSRSLQDVPWTDPSWELHGHSSSRAWYKRELDFYYDLHPRACWTRGGRKTAHYPKWLAQNTVPIYMQRKHPEVPASIEYPKGRILLEFGEPRPYFTNHVAWIIALALSEGVQTIGLFGINYGIESEYQIQRASCEYWIGRAQERGCRVILPEQCDLLRQPGLLYGYESHDEVTGKRVEAYRVKEWPNEIKPIEPGTVPPKKAEPTPEIQEQIDLEEQEMPRPDWALGPLPERTDGGLESAG